MVISIDLKPGLSPEMLNDRIRRDLLKYSKKEFKNSLSDLLPSSLIPVIVRLSKISPKSRAHRLTEKKQGALLRF